MTFERVLWIRETVPDDIEDLPSSIKATDEMRNCIDKLTPVDFFVFADDIKRLNVCENIYKEDVSEAYLWTRISGRPLDIDRLSIVHQSFILNRFIHFSAFMPSFDEIYYQIPESLRGKKMLLLIEGPKNTSDMKPMLKYLLKGQHVSRMTLFNDDYLNHLNQQPSV